MTFKSRLRHRAELLAEEAGSGTSYERIPIRDEGVPEEPKTMAEIIAAIHRAVAEGGITYSICDFFLTSAWRRLTFVILFLS